jgi:galactonate dehydratase
MKIAKVEPLIVNVSSKTNWFFIRVETDNGLSGIGEASLNGWEPLQLAYTQMLAQDLIGKRAERVGSLLRMHLHSPGGLVAHSIRSAVEQALTDIRAKSVGVPVHALLGGAVRRSVRAYANINRRTRERSPEGFAKSAKDAVAIGFNAIKVAPFDGVYWEDFGDPEAKKRVNLGLDRIFAIRDAIGREVDLMVDCHWRFDEASATHLLRELQAARLFWLECPISENPIHHAAAARLRQLAGEYGTRIAGAETRVGMAGFKPVVDLKLFDVIMPDIKYAGGFAEMQRISELSGAAGIGFSPHNPSGPVCNMASIHLCACAANFLILEYQLAESPLYSSVIGGVEPALLNGCFNVPESPGIGVTLDDDVIRAHPYRPLAANANLDPRLG